MSRQTTSSPMSLTLVLSLILYVFYKSLSFLRRSLRSSRSFYYWSLNWYSNCCSSRSRSASKWFYKDRLKEYSNSLGSYLMSPSNLSRFFLVSLRSPSYFSSIRSLKFAFFRFMSMTLPLFLINSVSVTLGGALVGDSGSSFGLVLDFLKESIFSFSSLCFYMRFFWCSDSGSYFEEGKNASSWCFSCIFN